MTKEGQDGGETFVLAGGVTGTCCDDWTQGYTNYRNRDPADLIEERRIYINISLQSHRSSAGQLEF